MAGAPRVKERMVHRVTSAPRSAAEDQDMRIRRYLFTMAIRTTCFVLAVVFEGWLRWAFVAGAACLPYVAVVLANAVGPRVGDAVSAVEPQPERALATGAFRVVTGTALDGRVAPTEPVTATPPPSPADR